VAVNKMIHTTANGRSYHAEVVADGVTSDPLILPSIYPYNPGHMPAVVAVIPAGGASGRIEFSLDDPAVVEAGTAQWIAWPHGDVSAAIADAINGPVTALRCVSVSGQVEWRVIR